MANDKFISRVSSETEAHTLSCLLIIFFMFEESPGGAGRPSSSYKLQVPYNSLNTDLMRIINIKGGDEVLHL